MIWRCKVLIAVGLSASVAAQDDSWVQVSAGAHHTCAIVKADHCHGASGVCSVKGAIECFGDDRYGQATPPPGTYVSVSAGRDTTCAILADGTVRCWGRKDSGVVASQPGRHYRKEWGRFGRVSAGGSHACGLQQGGRVTCWGSDQYGQASPPETGGMGFKDIDCGTDHTCGILTNGHVKCWGHDGEKQSSGHPSVRFTSVAAGTGHTCGLTIRRGVECWGRNREGQSGAPPGYFKGLSAGHRHSCGVRDARRSVDAVVCWGSDQAGEKRARFRMAGSVAQVSSGAAHACALTEAGEVRCWGSDMHGQAIGRTTAGLRGSG